MYYITPKDSKTGKKFQKFREEVDKALDAVNALVKELDIQQWRPHPFAVYGGISAVMFKKGVTPDPKVWKNVNGSKQEWYPNKRSKEGKELAAKLVNLPIVRPDKLNSCIGWNEPFSSIGFSAKNKQYFGFSVDEKWLKKGTNISKAVKIPNDCKEITYSEYQKKFDKKMKRKT